MVVTKPKGDCFNQLKMDCTSLIVTAPDQIPLISAGKLTIKKTCPSHPATPRETVPIPRSKSLHGNKIENTCAMPSHRHQSCSPPRPQWNQNSVKCSFKNSRCDSNAPLGEMCAEVNMSGIVNVPEPPPPMKVVNSSANAVTGSSVTRLLDEVRSQGQAKKQWNSCDEIEEKIKSQKRCSVANIENGATSQQDKKDIAREKPCELAEPAKSTEVTRATPQKLSTPLHQPTPPQRLDIPRRTLVDSFIPKEKSQEKGSDEQTKREEVSSKAPPNALEKVVTDIKSLAHQILGKPDGESTTIERPEVHSPVFTDSVKQRIQKFQNIVDDSSRSGSRPVAQIRGGSQVPDNEQKDNETTPDRPRQQSMIQRIIGKVTQGGIQGLSMLHREDEDSVTKITEMNRNTVEHEKSELLSHSLQQPAKESTPAYRDHLKSRSTPSAARATPIRSTPAPTFPKRSTPPHEESTIPKPIIPTIEISPTESANEDPVYDLTESLRGGQSTNAKDTDTPSTTTDSEVEYIPNELTHIHTVSSATRQASQRSTVSNVARGHDADDRFHHMIHTEPSLIPQEQYNTFAKKSFVAAAPKKQLNNCSSLSQRQNRNVGKVRGRVADAVVQQDDGCVATSTASDSSEMSMTLGQFVNASSSNKKPLKRAGRSLLETVHDPQRRDRFVDHFRGHDSGPSIPFSKILASHDNFEGDFSSSPADSSSDAYNQSTDLVSDEIGDLPGYSMCHGLRGGNNILDEDEEEEDAGDDEEQSEEMWNAEDHLSYQQYVDQSDSQSCTPQSFQGPYQNQLIAEDNLRNLNVHMAQKQQPVMRRSFNNRPAASYQTQRSGKDILMSKLVNASEQHLQRNYLDGLQSSREASSNDEMSVTGSSTGTDAQSMRFHYSLSMSMDENKPELNVNLMLLGDGEEEEIVDDEDRFDSLSCMSECTQLTQATRISVDSVCFTYSRPQLSESMLRSLMHEEMGGGEDSALAALFDSQRATEKSTGGGFNEESLTKFLDDMLRRNGLLSTSDELSLASASVPAFQSSGEE